MRPPPKSRGKRGATRHSSYYDSGFNEAPAEKQGKTGGSAYAPMPVGWLQ